MVAAYSPPEHKFIAFIDEAGDPGLKRVRPIDPVGASEWLVLGATLFRAEKETQSVQVIKQLLGELRIRQRTYLHFRDLNPERKLAVCQAMRHLEARFFVLASNKKNMRGYSNPRAEKVRSNQWFYNWCVRLLLERITDFVESRSLAEYVKPHFVKLVFSQRGGHSFTQTNAYTELIKTQSRAGTLILDKRSVKWAVLNRHLLEAHPSEQVAGLQVAD